MPYHPALYSFSALLLLWICKFLHCRIQNGFLIISSFIIDEIYIECLTKRTVTSFNKKKNLTKAKIYYVLWIYTNPLNHFLLRRSAIWHNKMWTYRRCSRKPFISSWITTLCSFALVCWSGQLHRAGSVGLFTVSSSWPWQQQNNDELLDFDAHIFLIKTKWISRKRTRGRH